MLEFSCEHRYAGGFHLDMTFRADKGVTVLAGPSGSGKTTTLLLVAGLLRPDHGRISLGADILVDTDKGRFVSAHRRAVGFVFQDNLLFPHLPVRGNLVYGMRRRGKAHPPFESVVNLLRLEKLLTRYPSTLSGGEARRVAIGRAILSGPKMLMLDEPLSGLDAELVDSTIELIAESAQTWGLPVLLVSHDQGRIDHIADRVIRMRNGMRDD